MTDWDKAAALQRVSPTVDMHTHDRSITPAWFRALGEKAFSIPSDPLTNLREAKIDLAVVTAVGDMMGTFWRSRTAWAGIDDQLVKARASAEAAGVTVVTNIDEIPAGGSAILLGIEGADVVGSDPERLADLYQLGVRVLGLVHYADNGLGTIGTSLSGGRGSRAVRAGRRPAGLTALGKQVIAEMNRLGMLIDLAHADLSTTISACEHSSAPVVTSHTGAAALQEFPRYISDAEVKAIAATGGLIGLWPVRFRDLAMTDLDDFARHASHLAQLVGPAHLCIGTDMNGVTGYVPGFDGAKDFPSLAAALLRIGFDTGEVTGILGGNALRVLRTVLTSSPTDRRAESGRTVEAQIASRRSYDKNSD
ncbi:dipeptidase [Mycobacteroides chelonae]|uniref:dipeptidase n=1 Tax=Mycobacteroides chelonae TaxID=1774 RepID=UPI000D6A6120|nr:membrane dipeptidase [Mycobacteroides chelonae]